MKIGILTFHREINDGSVLQAYCLYHLLKNCFPNDRVELIDYQPGHVRQKRRCFRLSKTFPFYHFDKARFRKKKSHNAFFYTSQMTLSRPLTGSNSLSHAVQNLNKLQYDAIVVGSDTVWDTRPNGGAPQAPNLFFLPQNNTVKKIAFAASMDKGGPRFVPGQTWKELITYINRFDYISVRDHATSNYLAAGGVDKNRFTICPTLHCSMISRKSLYRRQIFFKNTKILPVWRSVTFGYKKRLPGNSRIEDIRL